MIKHYLNAQISLKNSKLFLKNLFSLLKPIVFFIIYFIKTSISWTQLLRISFVPFEFLTKLMKNDEQF